MQRLKINSSHVAALLLSVLLVFSHWREDALQTLTWDAFGYYIYLPATLIQGDPTIQDPQPIRDLTDKYQLPVATIYYQPLENGRHVMKYSMGMAVLYSPAFLVAHGIAKATGQPADGLSPPYQYAVLYWSMLIALVGLWVLRRVLVKLYDPWIATCVLVAIGVGTNYYMHVMRAGDSVMTHSYLFTGYALVLHLTIRWHAVPTLRRILPLALTCGLMTLIRPTEGVCLLIPLLWNVSSWTTLRAKAALLWQSRWQLLAFAGLLILIGLPQFIYWKAATGHFIHTEYGGDAGEGMDWTRPHVREVLIGFRKGWLIYTPLMAFAILGMVALYRQQRGAFWALLVYLIADIYFVSAWSCYWYAFCFGHRALIPTMVAMSLPLAAGLRWAVSKGIAGRIGAAAVLLACIALNQFQSHQYDISLLHGDRMTWPYYKAIWGKLGVPHSEARHMLVNRSLPATQPIEFPELYTGRPFLHQDFDTMATAAHAPRLNGSAVVTLTKDNPYSPAIDIPFADITDQDHAFLRITGQVFAPHQDDHVGLITHAFHRDKPYGYDGIGIPVPKGVWHPFSITRITPQLRAPEDIERIYLLYDGPDTLYVEDIRIEVLTRQPSSE